MGQAESRNTDAPLTDLRSFESRSAAFSGVMAVVPLTVVEEILLNLPARVVNECRLVCHEWKELVDSSAHWRERCRREGIQPCNASRPPEDWRQFYFMTKKRRNLIKNPKAEDSLTGWEFVDNGDDGLCLKKQLIDLQKEGYSAAFMDEVQPHIKISDCSVPLLIWGRHSGMNRQLIQHMFLCSGFPSSCNPSLGVIHTHLFKFMHYGQFSLLNSPIPHVFGLWGETRSPRGNSRSTGRTCKLHTETPTDPAEARTRGLLGVRYGPYFDGGCEYQICVELLDQKKEPIDTFQPEKVVIEQWNDEPWCKMTHVFKDYGPGVRFIRFTHGGKHTQFYSGYYGIRVTNSSVEICPAAERE